MLHKRTQLPELYYMKNRHNTEGDTFNYTDKILEKSLTSYLFNNGLMRGFIERIQPLLSTMFDRMNIIKNFKNYNVEKYQR